MHNGYGLRHVIWDNLNIHYDGKDERWTNFNAAHDGKFTFHYTPIHASWVNQVDIFFSILQRKVLRHGSFASAEELKQPGGTALPPGVGARHGCSRAVDGLLVRDCSCPWAAA